MKIGDLVEYVGGQPRGILTKERQLGTIIRMDLSRTHAGYYIVWHTANNEGWWSETCLRVVSSNENR